MEANKFEEQSTTKITTIVKSNQFNYPKFIRIIIYSYFRDYELEKKIEKISKQEKMMI